MWRLQPESASAPEYWAEELERIKIIFLVDVGNESCEECLPELRNKS